MDLFKKFLGLEFTACCKKKINSRNKKIATKKFFSSFYSLSMIHFFAQHSKFLRAKGKQKSFVFVAKIIKKYLFAILKAGISMTPPSGLGIL